MTDFFALLDQPRNPWLDLDELKNAFHAKTLQSHPDAHPQSGNDFTQLNEAYQMLRDSKGRIQHLLELEGAAPGRGSGAIPREVEELFPAVAALSQQADAVLQKVTAARNALSRSLVQAEVIKALQATDEMLGKLRAMEGAA